MIARTWRITRESDQTTYFEYLQRTGLKEYASIPGNQGVWGLGRVRERKAEFTWSRWESCGCHRGLPQSRPRKSCLLP